MREADGNGVLDAATDGADVERTITAMLACAQRVTAAG